MRKTVLVQIVLNVFRSESSVPPSLHQSIHFVSVAEAFSSRLVVKIGFLLLATLTVSPPVTRRTELYDPNNPLSSDSEPEMSQLPPAVQNSSQRCKRPSPDRDASRWESSMAANRPLERRPVPQTARPTDSRDLSPGHVLANSRAYSPDSKLLDRPGYEFPTGHLEARIHSPDRLSHGSSSQAIPESFRGLRTNGGERKPLPDYPREVTPKVF